MLAFISGSRRTLIECTPVNFFSSSNGSCSFGGWIATAAKNLSSISFEKLLRLISFYSLLCVLGVSISVRFVLGVFDVVGSKWAYIPSWHIIFLRETERTL